MSAARIVGTYVITTHDGRSTEALVDAGRYSYAHSCITSDDFPARSYGGPRTREIVLLQFDEDTTCDEALVEAKRLGLEPPIYEDALYFGIEHPDVQREHAVVFPHDPWFGYFGRRDVLCLWTNIGHRELGLEGFDDVWKKSARFVFVRKR